MTTHARILQIIPSHGWYAHFAQADDSAAMDDPVVCFALVERWRSAVDAEDEPNPDTACWIERTVEPLTACDGFITIASDTDNYRGIFPATPDSDAPVTQPAATGGR